jgi:trimeric autotransporter adhesin
LVYCTGAGGLSAGYYYWSGSAWTALGGGSNLYTADGTLSGNRTVSTASGYTLTFSPKTIFSPSLTAASGSATGIYANPTLTAAANSDVLVGVDIDPTFTVGAFTGLTTYGLRVQGLGIGRGGGANQFNTAFGLNALKSNSSGTNSNTAIGYEALKSATSGGGNTAIGTNTMPSLTGSPDNTAVGANALGSITSLNGVGKNTALGREAGYGITTGYYNTAVGYRAGRAITTGYGNVSLGYYSLYSNTTGNYSTSIGTEALYQFKPSSNGNTNIGIGYRALYGGVADFAGYDNVAVGYGAIQGITTGTNNVGIGQTSLYQISTGSNNVALGSQSLYLNTTTNNNTAIGYSALWNNLTSGNNTGVGYSALYNTTGGNNTGLGYQALYQNNTGTNNTAVGYNAGPASGSSALNNTTAIGYNASVSADNTIQLGNSSITYIGGQVGFTAASDRRIKEDIRNSRYGLKDVMKLRAVDYTLTSNRLQQVGFVAQEVQAIVPEVVTGKEGDLSKGEILGVTYGNLVPVLTKAIQEQQAMIEQLQREIKALKAAMEVRK